MQRDCTLHIAGRGHLTSFSVEYKTGNQSLFECAESFTVDAVMQLRRFRRQYEQLSQFERGRIIGMMEIGWSARRVARQLGHSDCVVRRCWDQDPGDVIYTKTRLRTPSTDHSSRRPPHHKKCTRTVNCFIGHHPCTGFRGPLRVLLTTPTYRRLHLEWCRARGNWTAAEWNQVVFSEENPGSISAVMTIVFVCGDPVVNASILPLLYSDKPLPQLPFPNLLGEALEPEWHFIPAFSRRKRDMQVRNDYMYLSFSIREEDLERSAGGRRVLLKPYRSRQDDIEVTGVVFMSISDCRVHLKKSDKDQWPNDISRYVQKEMILHHMSILTV
ncbi:uncharacterized protein TNCV_1182091 [Trichonephila clavipes]|nr:uncharacterized protein TNCV_1182091 [Trichonephila clavipes]